MPKPFTPAPCAARARLCAPIAIVVAMTVSPSTVSAEGLQSVVARALANNPELGAIRFNRRAIDHELTAARGLKLPTVDLKADSGRHRDYNRTALNIVSGNEFHDHRNVSVIGSQRIFDGFEARHEEARQRNRVESARWRVTDTANSIALRAVQAYLEVQRADAVLHAARANLSAHQRLLSRVSTRVAGGRGTGSDESEARGRVANAQAIVAEAEQRVRDAHALFRSIVGDAPRSLGPAPIPTKALPASVEAAVAEARVAAPSILATRHDTTAAEAAIGSTYARFMPRLNFELSTDHAWGNREASDRTIDTRAMFVVRWNLFNGGIDKARVWEAKARALEAQEISQSTERIVERETRVSWNAIQAANERVPALKRQVDQVRLTRSAYSQQFDAGQRRLLDLLNIQGESFIAEASLRTEEFARTFNSYRILAAMGRLVPALGLEMPAEAAMPHAPTIKHGWRDGWENWTTVYRDYHRQKWSDVDVKSAKDPHAPVK
ncbi:MAG: hypothetical protein RL291_1149 [Pseudomonadota bacterium]